MPRGGGRKKKVESSSDESEEDIKYDETDEEEQVEDEDESEEEPVPPPVRQNSRGTKRGNSAVVEAPAKKQKVVDEDFHPDNSPMRGLHIDIALRDSPVAGKAVYAVRDIPKGTIVWASKDGDIRKYPTYSWAQIQSFPKDERDLFMNFGYQVDEDAFQGPHTLEEVAVDHSSYWNHSCDPNTWIFEEHYYQTCRDVKAGEELSVDYATFDSKFERINHCFCKNSTCRGKVTPDDWKNPELQKKYHGHFMPYLQRRIEQMHKQ